MVSIKIKILVIDDNLDNLTSIKALISDAFPEIEVFTAPSGRQVFNLAAAEDPDVILLDITMPEMDGFEVCRELKADPLLRDIPVIFVAAMKRDKENRIMALECGAEAFLVKPIDKSELTTQIRAMLKIREANILKQNEKDRPGSLVDEKISDLKKENQAKKIIQSDLFRVAQEISPDGFTILHPVRNEAGEIIDFIFVYENQAIARINQTDPQKVIGKRLLDFFPAHRGTSILEAYINVANTGNSQIVEDVNAGEVLSRQTWLRLVIVSMSEDIAILAQDITERKKAEDQIRQSEERFQLLFDQAPLGYQSLDFDGRFIDVNQQWLDTLGYSKEEVIGKWFGDFLCPEYIDGFRQLFPIFKSQGQIHSEFEMQSKDGRRLFIAFEGKIGYDDDGTFKQTHCILQDITNQRKAEKALIESEERYKCLFEYSGVGIGYYTTDGVVISYNKKALENIGGKPEDYIGKSLKSFFSGKEAEQYYARIEKAIVCDQPQEYEDYLVLDSTAKWFSSTFTRVKNITGEVIGVQIASLDITDRKQAEEALSESQAILNAAFENSQVGIAIADAPDGMLRFVNKAGLLIRNKSEEELVKNIDIQSYVDSWKILHFDGTPYAANKVPLARAVLYGETISEELIVRRDNNEDRIVLANAAPIKDSDNKIKAGIVVFLDITERKKIDEQLKQNWNDLSESQRIAHIGTWRLDLATNQVVMSNELYRMYGLDPTIPAPSYTEHMKLFTPESWDKLSTAIENTRIFGTPYELEIETIKTDGMHGWMWVRGEANRDLQGKIISLWGAAQDISERKKNELALRESEKLFRTSFENATIGGAMVATDGTFIEVNDKACEIWGYPREELLQLNFTKITFEEDIAVSVALITKILLGELDNSVLEKRYIKKDGTIIWGLVSVSGMRDENNEFKYFLIYIQNITEIKETESRLKYLGYHDHLTGLYNRRFFEEEIKRVDTKSNLPISVIMCDINGLKLINDSFGHGSGDELLIKAAEMIKKACRADDIVSRFGGDEFVIILLKTNTEETLQIAKCIKEFTSNAGISKIELSISYGYDTKITEEQSMVEILANAENHMYRHKLYERSSKRSKTVELIMNTLFEKSDRESQHSARVSNICQAIASKMNFDKVSVNKIRIAGLVHDIGKMGIDEKILNKDGELNGLEWEQIKRHPEVGWRILSSANEFSELAQYILNHHERWDGSGYPNGLKGEKIPLEARIITVADAYDAMTCERSYRKGVSQDEAVNELKRCSGTQFDPEIVDVFVNQVLSFDSNFGQCGVTP